MSIFLLKYLAKIPFSVLYRLSDVLYYVIYYIAGYRKNVVSENLKKAFPEKSSAEIAKIRKKFFRYFCDLTLETIKLQNMDNADFKKRVRITNPELPDLFYVQQKSIILLTMHYANWEWSSYLQACLKHRILAVYKPLHNLKYDTYINDNRKKFGAEMVPNRYVLRRILRARDNDETLALWMAGDQTPPLYHKFWLTFLNQEAMFYPGPAVIAHKFNYPVILQKTTRKARGQYEITFELLTENPSGYSDAEIMKLYIKKMEETIRKQPEYYLWSHKRWKHVRPAGVPLQE